MTVAVLAVLKLRRTRYTERPTRADHRRWRELGYRVTRSFEEVERTDTRKQTQKDGSVKEIACPTTSELALQRCWDALRLALIAILPPHTQRDGIALNNMSGVAIAIEHTRRWISDNWDNCGEKIRNITCLHKEIIKLFAQYSNCKNAARIRSWVRNNRRPLTQYDVMKVFGRAYLRAQRGEIAVSGFRATELLSC